jgi:murein endopeptidase
MRWAAGVLVACALALPGGALAQGSGEEPAPAPEPATPSGPSRAIGKPWHGRLVNGVQLPEAGPGFLTWDDPLNRMPNRADRRWGTTTLVRITEQVLAGYQEAHSGALPVLVGDLSRPHGGTFGERYGGLGHASHQNGLDVDIYYPRLDGLEQPPEKPSLIDRERAQWLVNRVARTAHFVFIGPHTGLRPPNSRVQYLQAYHDNHFHLRIWP